MPWAASAARRTCPATAAAVVSFSDVCSKTSEIASVGVSYGANPMTVSYTHLTLPTILRV